MDLGPGTTLPTWGMRFQKASLKTLALPQIAASYNIAQIKSKFFLALFLLFSYS